MLAYYKYFCILIIAGTKAVIGDTAQDRERRLCVIEYFQHHLLLCGLTSPGPVANHVMSIEIPVYAGAIQALGDFATVVGHGNLIGTQLAHNLNGL